MTGYEFRKMARVSVPNEAVCQWVGEELVVNDDGRLCVFWLESGGWNWEECEWEDFEEARSGHWVVG